MPMKIASMAEQLILKIKEKNPRAVIAFNAILARPVDIPEQMREIRNRKQITRVLDVTEATTSKHSPSVCKSTPPPTKSRMTTKEIFEARPPMERKRRHTNREIRKVCTLHSVYFLETWKGLETKNKEVNLDYYAKDGLHLNDQGVAALRLYIQGNSARLLNKKTSFRPKRNRGVKRLK
jgi:hypothetical protein